MKIFLLEDDTRLSSHLSCTLSQQSWSVQVFNKVSDLQLALKIQNDVDLVLLDRLVADGDSMTKFSELKNTSPATRFVVLSSIDFPHEKAKWLSAGADDYMGKPIFTEELIARIRLIRNRTSLDQNQIFVIRDLSIHRVDHTVHFEKIKLDLTAKEFSLLNLLAEKPGRIFNKFQILEHVWGYDSQLGTNVVESTINHLRRKLETAGSQVLISNKRNLGYWIEK